MPIRRTLALFASTRLNPGEVLELDIGGEAALAFRTTDGRCHIISGYCPHMGNYMPNGLAPGTALSQLLQHDEVRCPYHGWRFDGGGRCTHIPQAQRLPQKVQRGEPVLKHWQVRESDGWVAVDIDDISNE
jgi:3-ketosteroid 9alpha-monooxygenase subunit A